MSTLTIESVYDVSVDSDGLTIKESPYQKTRINVDSLEYITEALEEHIHGMTFDELKTKLEDRISELEEELEELRRSN